MLADLWGLPAALVLAAAVMAALQRMSAVIRGRKWQPEEARPQAVSKRWRPPAEERDAERLLRFAEEWRRRRASALKMSVLDATEGPGRPVDAASERQLPAAIAGRNRQAVPAAK